jgi:hypothetical protein
MSFNHGMRSGLRPKIDAHSKTVGCVAVLTPHRKRTKSPKCGPAAQVLSCVRPPPPVRATIPPDCEPPDGCLQGIKIADFSVA